MAQLSGNFNADFSSFTKACEQAVVSLTGFQDKANVVQGAVNRVADSLSGVKIAQQAAIAADAIEKIGGVSRLTNDELLRMGAIAQQAVDKLNVMGEKVPPNIQNLADRARGASEEMLRLNDATEKTGGTFGQFAGKVNIREALEHPIATATEGMKALAESMGPMGVAAVGIAGGIAAVGTVLFELTEKAAAAGGRLNDLSEKTGMSVPALSMLSKAVAVAGGDMDQMSNAVFMLQKRMGENTPEFQKGMEKLSISSQDWKNVGIDGYLQLVAEKYQATGDQAQRTAGLSELFGRSARELVPTLMKLHEAAELVSDFKPWTAEQAKQAEEFEMRMRSLKLHVEAFAMGIGKDFIGPATTFLENIGGITAALDGLTGGMGSGFVTQFGVAREGVRTLGDVLAILNRQLHGTKEGMDEIPEPTDHAQSAIARLYNTVSNFSWAGLEKEVLKNIAAGFAVMAGDMGTIPAVAGPAADALARQAAETEKLEKETRLHVMTATEQKLLEQELQVEVDKHTAFLKELGENTKAVRKLEQDRIDAGTTNALGLSKMENDLSQQQLVNLGKANDQIMAMNARLTDDYRKQTMDRATYENLKLWESAEAQIEAFKKLGVSAAQVTQFSNAVYEETAIKAGQIQYTATETVVNITDEGINAMIRLVAAHERELAKAASIAKAAADDAANAWTRVRYSMESSYTKGDLQERAAKTPGSSVERDYYGNEYLYIPGVNAAPPSVRAPGIQGFASGIENFGGGLALVGERGPELVNLPAGSDVIPNGRFGGSVVTNVVIHVNGTAAEVAQKVAAELMRTLKSGQQLTLR